MVASVELETLLEWKKWNLNNSNHEYHSQIYMANKIANVPLNRLFMGDGGQLTQPTSDIIGSLKFTSSTLKADYVLVPHDWRSIFKNRHYLRYLNDLSHSTPLLIINMGDIAPKCSLNNSLEIRTYLHPRESLFRKIIVPYPSLPREFTLRSWRKIPRISFMGYVPRMGPGSLFGKSFKYYSPIDSSVYLHRKISLIRLSLLRPTMDVKLIKRNRFTPISTNPDLKNHIREFDEHLEENDYILCPRGFANTSIRLYETISSGATPIIVDSKSDFPKTSQTKFWEENTLKLRLFSGWEKIISEDWKYLGQFDNYAKRQLSNMQVFQHELFFPIYMSKLFKNYNLGSKIH